MRIILSAISDDLIEAWKLYFLEEKDVIIKKEDITKLKCDAVISPANSFGFMDGGLDYALSERFGWDLEKKLQKRIKELPEGELLVGKSLLLETDDDDIPFLISAPTMRVPTNFNIDTSINAYLAMKAILILAKSEVKIKSVAIPGLCTGVGKMKPKICAKQMFIAYQEIILGKKMDFKEFGDAQRYHWDINQKGMIWTN
ncbi:macro domain-containing protein [Aquimarina sp. Aq107]|uniref:macro domain-containing protein n=1 Tax=Aquimarina sp. Aq107 TaxID=1191912 RepID=UPI000D55CAED|nr:macro domain-containing protein [Aquimarina sp. Aq107]